MLKPFVPNLWLFVAYIISSQLFCTYIKGPKGAVITLVLILDILGIVPLYLVLHTLKLL